jgi:Helicase associated domain
MVWDPHVQDWRDGLADCRDFHTAHGHLEVPPKATGWRIKALGGWITRRRAEYRRGELPVDRISALEELGMKWQSPRERKREASRTR